MNFFRVPALFILCATFTACVTGTDYEKSYYEAARNQNVGNFAEAEKFHRLALEQMQATEGVPNVNLALQMSNLATAISAQRETDEEAVALVEESLRLVNQEQNPGAAPLGAIVSNHGGVMIWHGRLEEADADCQRLRALDFSELDTAGMFNALKHYCVAMTSVLRKDFATADAEYTQFETALVQEIAAKEIQRILELSRDQFRRLKALHQPSEAQ